MVPEKFHNQYRISSARAPWHGYDGGSYFVTICTAHREHHLGKIFGTKMHLTAIGQIVATNLQTVSKHYQYAEIPLYVIMPNHLHAIVLIDGKKIHSPGVRLGIILIIKMKRPLQWWRAAFQQTVKTLKCK